MMLVIKQLKNNSPFYFLLLINVLYIFLIFRYLGEHNWDFPGHLYQAKSSLLDLNTSIYNFKYFLGFYPILYPPLVHTIVILLSNLFGFSLFFATVTFLLFSQSVFFYFLYKIFQYFKVASAIYIVVGVIFILTSIGFRNLNPWMVGTVPSSFGYMLFTLFIYLFLRYGLSQKNYIFYGFLFGIIILSHTITATAVGIFLLAILLVSLIEKKFDNIKYLLLIIIIGIGIGAIWVVPFLTLNSLIPRNGLTGNYELTYLLIVAILSFGVIKNYDVDLSFRKKIMVVTVIILAILATIPESLDKSGLQLIRYGHYLVILIFPLAFQGSVNDKRAKYYKYITILLLLLLFIRESNYYSKFPHLENITDIAELEAGRVMDVSTAAGIANIPHYPITYLVEKYNLTSSDGLFVENTPNALFPLATKMAINENAWFPLFKANYRYLLEESEYSKIKNKLDVLGINYFIVGAEEAINYPPENLTQISKLADLKVGNSKVSGRLGLVKINDSSPLIQVLNYIPTYKEFTDPVNDIKDMEINSLFSTDKNILEISNLSFDDKMAAASEAHDVIVDTNTISFSVDSSSELPVLVKFTYSPLLKAYNADGQVRIYRVSPDFILLVTKGDTKIYVDTPKAFALARYLSLSLFFIIGGYVILQAIILLKDKRAKYAK